MKLFCVITLLANSFVVKGQAQTPNSDIWRVYVWRGVKNTPFGNRQGHIEINIHKDLSIKRYDYKFSGHPDYTELDREHADTQTGKLFHVKGNTYLFVEYINSRATNNSWTLSIHKRRLKFLAVGKSMKARVQRRFGLRLMRSKDEL